MKLYLGALKRMKQESKERKQEWQQHNHSTPNVASEAKGLLSKLSTFEFYIMLVLCNNLVKMTYILSNYLPKESLNVNTAGGLIDTTVTL